MNVEVGGDTNKQGEGNVAFYPYYFKFLQHSHITFISLLKKKKATDCINKNVLLEVFPISIHILRVIFHNQAVT